MVCIEFCRGWYTAQVVVAHIEVEEVSGCEGTQVVLAKKIIVERVVADGVEVCDVLRYVGPFAAVQGRHVCVFEAAWRSICDCWRGEVELKL